MKKPNPLSKKKAVSGTKIVGRKNKEKKGNYKQKLAEKRERQGYSMKGIDGHWASVDPKTGKFLKSSSHPTVHKETNWYKSDSAKDFRKGHKLVTKNVLGNEKRYYKYKKLK